MGNKLLFYQMVSCMSLFLKLILEAWNLPLFCDAISLIVALLTKSGVWPNSSLSHDTLCIHAGCFFWVFSDLLTKVMFDSKQSSAEYHIVTSASSCTSSPSVSKSGVTSSYLCFFFTQISIWVSMYLKIFHPQTTMVFKFLVGFIKIKSDNFWRWVVLYTSPKQFFTKLHMLVYIWLFNFLLGFSTG